MDSIKLNQTILSKKEFIFICTGNHLRSRYAEALLNSHLGLVSESRGLDINHPGLFKVPSYKDEGNISFFTGSVLESEAISLEKYGYPVRRQLEENDFTIAKRYIAMCSNEHKYKIDKQFSKYAHLVEYWNIPDYNKNSNPDYKKILLQVNDDVMKLVRSYNRTLIFKNMSIKSDL